MIKWKNKTVLCNKIRSRWKGEETQKLDHFNYEILLENKIESPKKKSQWVFVRNIKRTKLELDSSAWILRHENRDIK